MNKLDAEDEEAWLAQRWELVTGSAAAVIMGKSPFKTRLELLAEYIYKESSFSGNRKSWFGLQMETAIGRALGASLGALFSPCNELRWETGAVVGSTMDGYLSVSDQLRESSDICPSGHKKNWKLFADEATEYVQRQNLWVEIKNTGGGNLRFWNMPGSPPENYWAQCQTQMLVLDEPKMALIALVGGQDFRGHIIHRDHDFLDKLQETAKEFMEQVQEGRDL